LEDNKSKLIVLYGLPLSGKNYIADKICNRLKEFEVIDVDDVRKNVILDDKEIVFLGEEKEFKIMKKSYNVLCKIAKEKLLQNKSIIITGTFSKNEFKNPLYSLLKFVKNKNIFYSIFNLYANDRDIEKRIGTRKKDKNNLSNIDSIEKYNWAKSFFKHIKGENISEINTSNIESFEEDFLSHIHYKYSKYVLKGIKGKINNFFLDVDGTIKSSQESENPIDIIRYLLENNKNVNIITASGFSALDKLGIQIQSLLNDFKDKFIFLSIANGAGLYKITYDGVKSIYTDFLNVEDIKNILWVYKKLNLDIENIQEKGISTFKKFLDREWDGIPDIFMDISKSYEGLLFIEPLKISIALPKKDICEFNRKFNCELKKKYRNKYIMELGDYTFAHITKNVEGKLKALNYIKNLLNLGNEEIAVFGDMYKDNDKGMLVDSNLPYTFTNSYVSNQTLQSKPYSIINKNLIHEPVKITHKYIKEILEDL